MSSNDMPSVPPSEKQQAFLQRHRIRHDELTDFQEAMDTIHRFVRSKRQLEPTQRQIQILKQHNQWRVGMKRGEAFDAIKLIFARG